MYITRLAYQLQVSDKLDLLVLKYKWECRNLNLFDAVKSTIFCHIRLKREQSEMNNEKCSI